MRGSVTEAAQPVSRRGIAWWLLGAPVCVVLLDLLRAPVVGFPVVPLWVVGAAGFLATAAPLALAVALIDAVVRRAGGWALWPAGLPLSVAWICFLVAPLRPFPLHALVGLTAALPLLFLQRCRGGSPVWASAPPLAALAVQAGGNWWGYVLAAWAPAALLWVPTAAWHSRRVQASLVALGLMGFGASLTGHGGETLAVRLAGAPAEGREARVKPEGPAPQSVVFLIVMDAARRDAIDLSPETTCCPQLRRLARDGRILTRFVANSAWTPGTHASMFTGLVPSEHGVGNSAPPDGPGVSPLPASARTLAEILRDQGVETAGFVANSYLGESFGFAQGFEHYEMLRERGAPLSVEAFERLPWRVGSLVGQEHVNPYATSYLKNEVPLAGEVLGRVSAFLARRRTERPLFVFVNVMDQHFIRYFPDPETGRLTVGPRYWWEPTERLLLRPESLSARAEELLAWHRTTMRPLDAALGGFFEDLRRRRLYARSTIIVTADHGNQFGEDGFFDHKWDTRPETTTVPFLVKSPAGEAVASFAADRVYQQVDLFAEILDRFGIAAPLGTRGRPLAAPDGSEVLIQLYRDQSLPAATRPRLARDLLSTIIRHPDGEYHLTCSTNGRHRLLRVGPDLWPVSGDLYPALFDLPEVSDFIRRCPSLLRRGRRPAEPATPELQDRLRALGYIG